MRTAEKVYAMLENEALWQAAVDCHVILAAEKIPHAVLGGVAVCLHGYQRNTVDVDLLVRNADSAGIRAWLERNEFTGDSKEKECTSPAGIVIQFLIAGERAGKDSDVFLPDPADNLAITEIEGLPVLRLSRLIESKIACGTGSLRRTYKDFADVIELIIRNRLGSSFARYLHKSIRATYRELAKRSRAE